MHIRFALLLLSFFVISCNRTSNTPDRFVSIKDGHFYLEGKPFYPLGVNYSAAIQSGGGLLWPASSKSYGVDSRYNYTTREGSLRELRNEFQQIHDMGFNTIRVVGIGEEYIESMESGLVSASASNGNINDTTIYLANEKNYKKYFSAISDLLAIADSVGLKVILLVRMNVDVPQTEKHLIRLLDHFKDNSAIFAYDLFNEPLYFDLKERPKKVIYDVTKKWHKIVRKHAPNQLSTIGLTGVREVFEWDPNILDFDFLTFHPYEYEPEQVRNEMYWYGNYVKVPWMIGETSLPADNDSVSYEDQYQFAVNTLNRNYNCGGIGYAWWQYKDVEWYRFHPNFMGVMNAKDFHVNSKGDTVMGTPKPVAKAFTEYVPGKEKGPCDCLDNYYNYTNHKGFRLTGKLVDKDDNPIQGGIILAWNKDWLHSYNTSTKADGTFELLSDYPFYHWIASATLHTVTRADISPDSAFTGKDGIPTIDLGTLKIKKLYFID